MAILRLPCLKQGQTKIEVDYLLSGTYLLSFQNRSGVIYTSSLIIQ